MPHMIIEVFEAMRATKAAAIGLEHADKIVWLYDDMTACEYENVRTCWSSNKAMRRSDNMMA